MEKAVFSFEKSPGWGRIYKSVLLDTGISAQAKGLYAYLASYGLRICPSRDRILHDLGIQKDTYYTHRDVLVGAGVLTVGEERGADGRHSNNLYTLQPHDGGYGWVGKDVMSDPGLGLRAKALYALYCVFAGGDGGSQVRKADILYFLGMGEDAYLSAKRELTAGGYIVSEQASSGRFGRASVTVTAISASSSPCRENQDTAGKDGGPKDTAGRDSKITRAEKTSLKNTSIKNSTAEPDGNIIPMPLLDRNVGTGEGQDIVEAVSELASRKHLNISNADVEVIASDAARYGRSLQETLEILEYSAAHATSGIVGYARTLLRSYSRPVAFSSRKTEIEAKRGRSSERGTDYNEMVMRELMQEMM